MRMCVAAVSQGWMCTFCLLLFSRTLRHILWLALALSCTQCRQLKAHLKALTAVSRKSNLSLIFPLERHVTVFGCWKTLVLFKCLLVQKKQSSVTCRSSSNSPALLLWNPQMCLTFKQWSVCIRCMGLTLLLSEMKSGFWLCKVNIEVLRTSLRTFLTLCRPLKLFDL